MDVGLVYVTELTVTPPDTEAASRFGNPAPGSKNPEPETDVPLTTTDTEAWPAATVSGAAVENAAGGGAISSATRTPYESVASQYSWIVHIVMSSVGIDAREGVVAPASRRPGIGRAGCMPYVLDV